MGLNAKDVPHHAALRRASVLVPLLTHPDTNELFVLLTQRPLHLSSHPGEVCFPGGKQDPDDHCDDVVTALREAKEEVGLEADSVEILCRLRTIESYHHLCVTPIVGLIKDAAIIESLLLPSKSATKVLTANPTEVAALFVAPLSLFHRPPVKQFAVEWSQETFIMRHYEYRHSLYTQRQVFSITGLTAHIANHVAELVFGSNNNTQPTEFATTTPASFMMSGEVWIREQSSRGRAYWSRRFLVLDASVLHLYDNAAQAQRKTNSASKKNRMGLHKDTACQVLPSSEAEKKEFLVAVLEGQVEWRLAVATTLERNTWVEAILQTSQR